MTKIIDLDKLATKQDKAVKLGGVEHYMKNLTVQDYVLQMKASSEINKMMENGEDNVESAERIMELTIEALSKLFPTITIEQFNQFTMEQLTAIRELAEDFAAEEAPAPEAGE